MKLSEETIRQNAMKDDFYIKSMIDKFEKDLAIKQMSCSPLSGYEMEVKRFALNAKIEAYRSYKMLSIK